MHDNHRATIARLVALFRDDLNYQALNYWHTTVDCSRTTSG
jgi:hypothetical protein